MISAVIPHRISICLISFCTFLSAARAQSGAPFPLDPLTAPEMEKVVQILKSSNTTTGKDLFNIINLKEPPKAEVLAYKPGDPFRREAFASFYDYAIAGVREAVVDLNAGKVISVKNVSNVIGMGLEADSAVTENIVRKDPQ